MEIAGKIILNETIFVADRFPCLSLIAGSIYCVGGMDNTGHSLSSVERYNLSNGRVSIEASMNSPRSGVGVAVLEGKLYSVGRSSCCIMFLSGSLDVRVLEALKLLHVKETWLTMCVEMKYLIPTG